MKFRTKVLAGVGMGTAMMVAGATLLGGSCDLPRFPDSHVGMMCELPRHGYYFMVKQQFLDEIDARDVNKSLATPACRENDWNAPCARMIDGVEAMVCICLKEASEMKMIDASCEFEKQKRQPREAGKKQ